MTSKRFSIALLASVAVLIPGCDESPPQWTADLASERVLLRISADRVVPCEADLRRLDERVEFVETHLGLPPRDPIKVRILGDDEDSPCIDSAAACYLPTRDEVYTHLWWPIEHELVHAASKEIDFPTRFWSECTAEVLTGKQTVKLDAPFELDDLDAVLLRNYATPAHFCRHLIETRGWDRFRRVIRGEAIDTVYGEPVESLVAEYEEGAPFSYPSLVPAPAALPSVGPGEWSERVALSCDDDESSQFELEDNIDDGLAVRRGLMLEAGTYAMEQRGGERWFLTRRYPHPLEVDPTASKVDDDPVLSRPHFEADLSHSLTLPAGSYVVTLTTGDPPWPALEFSVSRLAD